MLSTVERVLFLKSVELFSQIPGEDLAQLALIATEETRERDEEVVHEGDPGDALYLVLEGSVRVHRGGRTIAEIHERECFGEMSLLDSEPRSATVTALNDVSLLKIQRDDFQEMMAEKPEIASGVIKVLSRRLREANQR
ncbi:MAG: Crp/Fnr family transcriptional regulator [Myxococcaceae bacterium]